jgi:outer membrane protein TolC
VKLKKYNRLKAAVDKAKVDHDKAQGTIDYILKGLKDNFNVASLKEAERLYKKLQADEQAAEVAFEEAQARFQRKYSDLLSNP